MSESKMHLRAREHFAKKQQDDISPSSALIKAEDLKPGMVWVGEKPIKILEVSREEEVRVLIPWDLGRQVNGSQAVPMHRVIIKGEQPNPGFGTFKGTWCIQPDTPVEVTYGDGDG